MHRFLKILGGLFVALVVLVAALSVLGGRGEGETVVSRCEPATAEMVAAIERNLTITGGGTLRGAQAVQSADNPSFWLVAGDLEGAGLESANDIGVWAFVFSNQSADPIMGYAADHVAEELSDLRLSPDIAPDADGIAEARACVGAAR